MATANTTKTRSRSDQLERLARVRLVASLMDTQYSIFGIRFGLDSIIGLVPWFGDIVAGLISLYIVWQAFLIGLPKEDINKMISNVLVDVFVGGVPVLGDIFDLFFKANVRNMAMIEKFLRA